MKRLKKCVLLILTVLVICFIFLYGVSFARYVSNSVLDYYLKSKGFYFYSDYLSSSSTENIDNYWDGESVYFSIRNNLNQTVMTNYDIFYTAKCTVNEEVSDYVECHLNGTDSDTYDGVYGICVNSTGNGIDVSLLEKTDCESSGYEWDNQIMTDDLYFDIVVTDNEYELSDVTANITVTSTSPYRKILKGDFILHQKKLTENQVTMDYKNYENYDRLNISNTYSENKCVRIMWDADKLLIDTDASEFASYEVNNDGYIEAIKFTIVPKKTLSYIFYKRDVGVTHDVTDFTIEETDGCQ